MKKYLAGLAVVGLLMGGCTSTPYNQRQNSGATIGAVSGGILGGLVGSSAGGTGSTILGVGLGALAGGLIGGAIGNDLDARDREQAEARAQYAITRGDPGERYEWRNTRNDNYGYTEPGPVYQSRSGEYCREYQTVVVVGGRQENAHGTACRQPDGSWRVAG